LRPPITTLLSNAWDNLRGVLEQDWRILDAFDQVIISAEVGLAKPDAPIYQLAVERLGVEPGGNGLRR
jgi:FMN phosphatase YigB (HAD superfamily)